MAKSADLILVYYHVQVLCNMRCHFKGIVQQKLMWVKSGSN
jgi:hypothetical protein